jgi:gamma-glutamyltranspeptidase/glutathione hydrolase
MTTNIDVEKIGWQAASTEGVVAAGSPESVAAGLEQLKDGGNAADAAVATILALCVTDHGACSIGGEVPLLVYDAGKQEVKALSGQGRAPRSQEAIGWYMEHGIPGEGDIKMTPVPSVVDLCLTTLKLYGTRTFADTVTAALALLDEGDEEWMPKLAVTLRKMVDAEGAASGSREEKIQAACDLFYGRGGLHGIADELEADYIEKGGFLRVEDLAAHKTMIEDPVSVDYKGYTICKCGPWTQGPYLCQALRLLEGFDLHEMGQLSANTIHVAIEALKLAMADRDEYYGDPEFVDVPLEALLSDPYTNIRRPLIDIRKASREVRPGDPLGMQALKGSSVYRPGIGGTTTCVVADRWGNVISATPSANVPRNVRDGGKAGVTMSNRLRSLNTTPGHPNCIQPGKRPRITLTPTLVLKEGKPVMAISVAGGDLQDQVTLNLLLNAIEFGMGPEECVTAPRFATGHHEDSFDPDPDRKETFKHPGSLTLNDVISQDVQEDLAERGHRLELKSEPIGRPVMLSIDQESGLIQAAGDPEAARHAGGL